MPVDRDLKLEFADAGVAPIARHAVSYSGFAAEHVRLEGVEGFTYSVTGKHHYIALHDILLADGEAHLDGAADTRVLDLRNAISFIPRGCTIAGWSQPVARLNTFTALYFDPEQIRDDLGVRFRSATLRPLLYVHDRRLQVTLTKLQTLLADGVSDDLYAEALCMTAALELMQHRSEAPSRRLSEKQMKLILDYLEVNHGRSLNISELAQLTGLSWFHFARMFKTTTGRSPYQFVTEDRINRATKLLVAGRMPIEVVASTVGFNSASQFGRAFRKVVGETPRAFRTTFVHPALHTGADG